MKKLRLLSVLLAAAGLGGCATYDYAGGSAPGGYYYGRASSAYGYGPYDSGYGYPYGYGGYYSPYYGYGGYYPYYPYYPPHRPRPPRPPRPYEPEDRAPPWRDPVDGRYRESGRVLVPPRNRVPQVPGQPQTSGGRPAINNPGVRQRQNDGQAPPRMSQPSAPRVERSRPVERAAPVQRSQNRDRVRNDER